MAGGDCRRWNVASVVGEPPGDQLSCDEMPDVRRRRYAAGASGRERAPAVGADASESLLTHIGTRAPPDPPDASGNPVGEGPGNPWPATGVEVLE